MSQGSISIVPQWRNAPNIEAMQNRIRDTMYHSEDASKRFIGQEELRAIWADIGLRTIFPTHSWEDHEVQIIRKSYLKVLSVLVMIAWPGVCGYDQSRFREHFLQRPHDELADLNLPFAKERLAFLKEYAINFREKQLAFCPVIIEEREASYIQEIAADRPLPFTEEESTLGEGASGKVRKVVIARYCFGATERTLNVKEMHVACKTFPIGRPVEFRREFRRLGWVKEAKKDIRIMKHIAALAHGDTFMILLPVAEHFDLDAFLRHGSKPTHDTKDAVELYDFDTRFPHLKDDNLAVALVKELSELASAVQWLHEGNEASRSFYRSLAHMDLKPENILIGEDPSSPIGKWMLSDFGVSLFVLSQEVSHAQCKRTTASSYLNEPQRGRGTYQPPEIKHPEIDGHKCDVWSFGCILLDVMSFALGRTKLFHKVRALRNSGGDDYFYQTELNRIDTQTPIDDANTKLKSKIRDWLKAQKRNAKHPRWVARYINIVDSTLKCDPQNRPNIGFIVCALSGLWQDTAAFVSESVSWPSRNQFRQCNTSVSDQTHGLKGRDMDEVSAHSDTSFDTDAASSLTSEHSISYSPPSDHTGPQSGSSNSFGRQDRDSIVTTRYSLVQIGLDHASTATDGSGSIQIGWEPESRSSTPTPLSHRLGLQSLQNRPLGVRYSPKEISRIGFPAKATEKILALALSPSGDHAAVLFRYTCHIYATSGDIQTGKITIELERKVKWTRLCIGSQYLVVYGTEQGPVFQNRVVVFDTRSGRISWAFDKEIHGAQVSDVIISTGGVAAGAYEKHLLIRDLSRERVTPFDLEKGLIIKNLAFSANGRWLCAWVISIYQGCDRSYFWEISQHSIDFRGFGSYRRVDDATTDFFLWCCPDDAACVIHERHYGLTSIVQLNGRTDQDPESRQDLAIPGLLNACITPRRSLVYAVKPSMLSRRRELRFEERLLNSERDLFTSISNESATHRANVSKWTNAKIAAAAQSESTELITLCTFKRNLVENVKYTVDYE